jgi:hypothetical protein
MRPRDRERARELENGLVSFDRDARPLPGIHDAATHAVFIEQLLESIHRVDFVAVLGKRSLSSRRSDPNDGLFDPLKAAIFHHRSGNVEEAFWLVFLFVYFGKHPHGGWRLTRDVYGRLGRGALWDWVATSSDPRGFREWLDAHREDLKRDGVVAGFGNHRKYESLNDTGPAVETYVRWVNPPRTHQELMQKAVREGGDPRTAFDRLYNSMRVYRFGRTARFDYLTMVGKIGLARIEPGSTYMKGATGPLTGAKLLFGVEAPVAVLERWLVDLDNSLNVGMQVLEDALCNWQKSPHRFKPFRG